MENLLNYYLCGALTVGGLKALSYFISFTNPDAKGLRGKDLLLYYLIFTANFLFWPATAIYMIGGVIGTIRKIIRDKKRRRPTWMR